jgi:chlorite dismutase
MEDRHFSFVAGSSGIWDVVAITPVTGASLPQAPRLNIVAGLQPPSTDATWTLRGVTSQERYVVRTEHDRLAAVQPPLGRPQATSAALIPIQKTSAWWELSQDQRRDIFEEQSHHIELGIRELPAVARRLYHSHDLDEPFDFLTWFEYAPDDGARFESLVAQLRRSPEWQYVLREVDVRLRRRA